VLVLDQFTDDLRAALAEPGERVVDVLHGEHAAEITESVHRGVAVIDPCPSGRIRKTLRSHSRSG
jgi:hypothetical protein